MKEASSSANSKQSSSSSKMAWLCCGSGSYRGPIIYLLLTIILVACGIATFTTIPTKCVFTLGLKGCAVEFHLCDWLQENVTYPRLQAITRSNRSLWVIESDHLYRIPMSNLNTTSVQMPLYLMASGKHFGKIIQWEDKRWYEYWNLSALPEEAKEADDGDIERYKQLNKSRTLKRFSLIPNHRHQEHLKENKFIRVWDFLNASNVVNDQLIYDEHKAEMIKDSMKTPERYAYRFTVVQDGHSKRGYLFHYDRPENETKRRVLISSLYVPQERQDQPYQLNLPQAGTRHPDLLHPNSSFYMTTLLRTERKKARLLTFGSESSELDDKEGMADFFVHLPLGFIANGIVYLFSEATHMVYYFDYHELLHDSYSRKGEFALELDVSVKSWPEFWTCDPNVTKMKKFEPPVEDADYMALAEKYQPSKSEMGSGDAEPAESSSPSGFNWLPAVTLLVGMVLTSCFCLCLIRHGKRRRKELREKKRKKAAAAAAAGAGGGKGTKTDTSTSDNSTPGGSAKKAAKKKKGGGGEKTALGKKRSEKSKTKTKTKSKSKKPKRLPTAAKSKTSSKKRAAASAAASSSSSKSPSEPKKTSSPSLGSSSSSSSEEEPSGTIKKKSPEERLLSSNAHKPPSDKSE